VTRCQRYVVLGRVQGVFFRAGARDQARRLGLSGWVRNRADGSVELVACGEDAALARLADWLRRGPPSAQVDAVEVSVADDPALNEFEVRG
jgi:acylphosphatase